MTGPNLAARGTRIGAIGSALQSTDTRLSTVVDGIKGVLADGSWREFVTSRGEHVQHDRFAEFVTTSMLSGLGVSLDLIERVIADDDDALDLLYAALGEKRRPRSDRVEIAANPDIVSINDDQDKPDGNSKRHALERLRKEADAGNEQAATLRAEVLAGRLSAHQAMVSAGYRPKTVTVPPGRPESVARTLRKHMSPEDLARLVALLVQEPADE